MPRTGWRKSESDRRLPDLVSVGLLMKVFPAEVVDAVITECGRTEKRRRSLPARSMAYFAMGMALHSEGSYEDVLAMISDGLAWAHRDERSGKLANKAAISHARDRLGPEPMAMLFERVARPLAVKDTPGCWLAGRRLVAIDGTCLDLPDTPANDAHFSRPGVMKGERSAFTQAPPARPPHGPALKVPEAGHPGDMGTPVLPLRDPHTHARRRRPRRPRPGPCLVRRRATHLPQVHRPTGRFSPLTHPTPSAVFGPTPSANSSAGCYPGEDLAPTPASSNASTPNGTSNDPITTTGPNPTGYPNRPW